MNDKILAVKEFHKAFKLDYLDEPKADLGTCLLYTSPSPRD